MSETTAPVSVDPLKDVIGPGMFVFLTHPAAPLTIIWGNSVRITRGEAWSIVKFPLCRSGGGQAKRRPQRNRDYSTGSAPRIARFLEVNALVGQGEAWQYIRAMSKSQQMSQSQREVQQGLPSLLKRLWRYGVVLTGDSETAHELVQATCLRALEKCEQFQAGTDLARWTYTILSSIWKNELRSRRIRMGQGFVDAEIALVADGVREMDTNLLARQVLKEVERLPEGQREAVFLVYGEGLSYKEAADVLDVPTGTIMSRLAAARAKLAGLRDRGDQMIPAE